MDLNAFEDNTESEAKDRGKRRVDEEARIGNIKLIGTIHAIDTIFTPVS